MIGTICSASLFGTDGEPVAVEVHVSNGIPGFTIVGLPDAACREARDRVRAALLSSALPWPMRRVTVNLAPSSLRKVGAGLDLPIAIGVLAATGDLDPEHTAGCAFLGELGLDGSLRPVPGTLALVDAARAAAVVVPAASLAEARLVSGKRVLGARSLREVFDALRGDGCWAPMLSGAPPPPARAASGSDRAASGPDLADVRQHLVGRQAIEVAAAGGHHLLLVGQPGAGKTLLARCLPGLLPALDHDASLAVRRVHSAAGVAPPPVDRPPVREPHHSASPVALVGGGSLAMRPGEISLADHGVLFLDELGEFPSSVLDLLRQPMEEGVIRVARARATVTYPARFLLVAATNPCPCGDGGLPGACRCSEADRARYLRRLSGPLLDRFDLQVYCERLPAEVLLDDGHGRRAGEAPGGESTAVVAARVARARLRARARGVPCNARLDPSRLEHEAPLSPGARRVLLSDLASGSVSARSVLRIRLVALTLADLAGHEGPLTVEHVSSALALRSGRGSLFGR